MKKDFYTQLSNQYIFSLFNSSKKRKNNKFKNHHHTEMELGLILKGKGEYILNNVTYTADEGDLFIVRSNEMHCVPTITSESLVAFNIQLSPFFLWNICSDYIPPQKIQALINPDISITHKLHDPEIIHCIKTISELMDSHNESATFVIRSLVVKVVTMISEKTDVSDIAVIPPVKHLKDIQNSIDYIKRNFSKQISLDDMAKNAVMSASYFSKIFKTVTGVSPYNYLMTTRIENALESLKSTNKTITEIALECGFPSITSFNKAFKNSVGCIPTEIRKKEV